MIPIEEIAEAIREGVAGYTGLTFRESSDQDEDGGAEPYLVLEFTDVMSTRGHPVVQYGDGVRRETRTAGLIATLYAYGPHKLERIIQAMKSREWMSRIGCSLLQDEFDCVLVSAGAVATRDYREYENGPWIRREGFDVMLRMTEVTELETEMIETANIKGADHVVTT